MEGDAILYDDFNEKRVLSEKSSLFEDDDDIELVDPELIKQKKLKEMRAKIGRKSKHKGAHYEHVLARKICSYLGLDAKQSFIYAKNHPEAGQAAGDLIPIKRMGNLWRERNFGPIESKNREEWAFNQFFSNNLEKNPVYKYWIKSNEDCGCDNSLIFFTKNHVNDFVFHRAEDAALLANDPYLSLRINGQWFIIQTLDSFMRANFDISV